MNQLFSAMLSGVGAARGADAPRNASPPANDDANTGAGTFDQMLQSQPSSRTDDTRSANTPRVAERSASSQKTESGERTSDAREETSSEAKPRTGESRDSRAAPESRSRDTEAGTSSDQDTTVSRDEAAPADASGAPQPEGATAQVAAPTTAQAPATLPEQLLALLNNLSATAPTTMPAPTDALAANADATARPGAAAHGATGLPLPIAMQAAANTAAAAAAPAAPEGDPSVFAAMTAMAAANDGGSDAGPDLAAISDTPAPTVATTTAASPASAVRTAAAVAPQAPVAMDANFDDAFGSRIAWMAEQRVGHAEIRVSPDHLGTIDVRLQLDGTRVNAEFHSAQADVRHALESSLPRLREMLGQSGLQLGQADVGQRQNGQPSPSNGQAGSTAQSGGNERNADSGWTPGPAPRASRGLLDEYA